MLGTGGGWLWERGQMGRGSLSLHQAGPESKPELRDW